MFRMFNTLPTSERSSVGNVFIIVKMSIIRSVLRIVSILYLPNIAAC